MSEEVARKVFADMEDFAKYAFNKSHAAAYAYLSYQTAYLKCYYPVEFLVAVLNNRITNIDEIKKYTIYAKQNNYEVLPPNVNKSETYFSVENNKIRFGLAALKNVGIGVVEEIIKERESRGDFKDLYDFIERMQGGAVNKRCLESMILSGAFDCFGATRSQMVSVYESVVDTVAKDNKNKANGQFSLFDDVSFSSTDKNYVKMPDIKEYAEQAKLKFEKQVLGIYLTGHPLDNYMSEFNKFTFNASMIPEENEEGIEEDEEFVEENKEEAIKNDAVVDCGGSIEEIKKIFTKNGNKEMAILKVEDLYGTYDVMVIPKVYDRVKTKIQDDALIKIHGKVSIKDDNSVIIIADDIILLNSEKPKQDEFVENITKEEIVKTLYLRYNTQDGTVHQQILSILRNYVGSTPVIIKCTGLDKSFKLSFKTNANNYLLNELNAILSEEDIKLL